MDRINRACWALSHAEQALASQDQPQLVRDLVYYLDYLAYRKPWPADVCSRETDLALALLDRIDLCHRFS
jgi:hypothetical protein